LRYVGTQQETERGATRIISGGEDKEGERVILREVARHLDGGKLVLATVASHQPEGYFEAYQKGFADLGITDLVELYLRPPDMSLGARLEWRDSILRRVVEENAGPSSAQKQDQDQDDKETGVKEDPEVPAQDTALLCHS
jgi:cyanophycinase-like exopeptidase